MNGTHVNRFIRQPQSAILTAVVACAAIAESWILAPPRVHDLTSGPSYLLFGVLLAAGIYLAALFPVHIRYTVKMELGSVPLFLLAVMLPPALAPLFAGAGLFLTDCTRRKVRDLYWSDIATQSARYMLIICLASTVAHLPHSGVVATAGLDIAAAVLLWCGDMLTQPLVIAPITGERALHIVKEGIAGMGLPESGQYFLGLMGAALSGQDRWAITLLLFPIALIYRISKRAKEMHESTRLLLEHMADSVDSRDPFTHEHSKRVTEWTRQIIKELQLAGPEAQLIVTAARVHDIGKVAVPDEVLHKHEQLTDNEWNVMKQHPATGAQMLAGYPAFARGAGIVRGHHERFDGKGYPDGLIGTDIPFGARLLAVADSFDAMVSNRPYRKGMAWERAAGILAAGRGTQWDPELVDAFLRVLEPYLAGEREQVAAPAAVATQMV